MFEICLTVLARAGMGQFLMPLLLGLLFSFLALKALRTGKVYYRGATYTKEDNYMMFGMVIIGLSACAFLCFVLVLSAMFEP